MAKKNSKKMCAIKLKVKKNLRLDLPIEYLEKKLKEVIVPTIEKWEGFLYSGVLVFFFSLFVFHPKSGTTINHRNGSSGISY